MNVKNVHDRIIVKVDTDGKNWHTFNGGGTIRIERDVQNLDKKYTSQVKGEVVSADNIPSGAVILFHHNCLHEINAVLDHDIKLGAGIELYSIKEDECYLWKMPSDTEWETLNGFATCLRVFIPYTEELENVYPEKMKNVLYITSGKLKGKVCHTLIACDYPIIFNNEYGREETVLRLRHFENEDNEREEVVAINETLTDKVNKGELLVGLSKFDCKKIF